MAGYTPDQIADLVLSTLPDIGRYKITDLMTDLQEYVAMQQILQNQKMQFGGTGPEGFIIDATAGSARHTKLFDEDSVPFTDGMTTFTVPWRMSTTAWPYDERERVFNMGATAEQQSQTLQDTMQAREAQAFQDLADLCEDTWWKQPVNFTDGETPFGIWYWIARWDTGATNPSAGGFLGLNPTGTDGVALSTGAGGISSTTHSRWSNYAAKYTNVSKSDLVKAMRKAAWSTRFYPVVSIPLNKRGEDNRGLYTTWDVKATMDDILESQNDNLGNDVASRDGMALFQGRPIQAVPWLQANDATAAPVYGINWAHFCPYFLEGEYLNRTGPYNAPNSHRVKHMHIDLTWNTWCTNRRAHFVISKTSSTGTTT